MKKPLLAFIFTIAGLSLAAQTPRLSLVEEFTGETCPPCAAYNPAFNTLLSAPANTALVVPIKWQVPIPSAPSNTWSLYQTDKTQIDWRWQNYGYGINSAPSVRIDGQMPTTFGAAGENITQQNATVFQTAQSYTSAFSVTMARAWDQTLSSVNLTINITASANFTATGNMFFRLAMVENEIHFPVQPGTNGEKDFYWAVRKIFPTTSPYGTALTSNTWTTGQTQTIVINCPLPSYIIDKSEVAFVGWIQDDGNRQVAQAVRAGVDPIPNDAKAISADAGNYFSCNAPVVPEMAIKNNGSTAITAMTITPMIDGTAANVTTWTGNLAVGATTSVTLNALTGNTNGGHNVTLSITAVSGTDNNTANNSTSTSFYRASSYLGMPVAEGFTSTAFPPALFGVQNDDGGASWSRSTVGGYALTANSAKYDFFDNNNVGDVDYLYLPPLNLGGAATPLLTFDVAYAQYSYQGSTPTNDKLEVFVSNDCGITWTSVYAAAGSVLSTAAPVGPGAFTPGAGNWRTENVYLPGFNVSTVLVRFAATSDYGNNLYLDNINLKQDDPTGIKSIANNNVSVELFPNPAHNETTLSIDAIKSANAKITVTNALGQVVYSNSTVLNAGANSVKIDASNFATGVYSVIIDSNNSKTVKKLSVN